MMNDELKKFESSVFQFIIHRSAFIASERGLLVAITIKVKMPGQRACNEKDAKGELCVGHLKRWYTPDDETLKQAGPGVDIYRCERCQALYRPAPQDHSSAGLRYDPRPVNLMGMFKKTVTSDK